MGKVSIIYLSIHLTCSNALEHDGIKSSGTFWIFHYILVGFLLGDNETVGLIEKYSI